MCACRVAVCGAKHALENSFFSSGSECIGKVIKCPFYTALLWNSTPGRSVAQLIFFNISLLCVYRKWRNISLWFRLLYCGLSTR